MDSYRIRYKGSDQFVLIGNLEEGGAIAFEDDYHAFRESYAHLMPDGTIKRHHSKIGTKDDIEILGELVC